MILNLIADPENILNNNYLGLKIFLKNVLNFILNLTDIFLYIFYKILLKLINNAY